MTIREQEDQIRLQPIEIAIAWDAEGTQVLKKVGEQHRIVFTDDELALLQGTVFTHNHPSGLAYLDNDPRSFGNSLSLSDVRLACYASLAEMRVVTPKLRFSLKPPAEGWNSDYWQSVLEPVYWKYKRSVSQEMIDAIQTGRMPQPMAEAIHFHEICRRTAVEVGLRYIREVS